MAKKVYDILDMPEHTKDRSRGRVNPTDIHVNERDGVKGEEAATRLGAREGAHTDADKDYYGNFKKFHRSEQSSREPNREGYGKKTKS